MKQEIILRNLKGNPQQVDIGEDLDILVLEVQIPSGLSEISAIPNPSKEIFTRVLGRCEKESNKSQVMSILNGYPVRPIPIEEHQDVIAKLKGQGYNNLISFSGINYK